LLDELKEQINERITKLTQKLNEPALSLDEFIELFVQAMDIASKSKSELKRQALAKALVNSLDTPN
jgi:exonuclease VII small subunit